MTRKRVTQRFPFLLPVRKWQRKTCFYLKMRLDRNKYACKKDEKVWPCVVYGTKSRLINENSGYDITFQNNKVHNLKLAAKTINQIVIRPGETFSFWKLVRHADKQEAYKDGLVLTEGQISGAYGGGLCQLSNLLFEMFLHTPLLVLERHGHSVQRFRPADKAVMGADAAVSEGWMDLKVRNPMKKAFQITISFDDTFMYGQILSSYKLPWRSHVFNQDVTYYRKGDEVYQRAAVWRCVTDTGSWENKLELLYHNVCRIGYALPAKIEEDLNDKEDKKCSRNLRRVFPGA